MITTTILEIIKLSLEITLELIKGMPPEQKASFAERHEKRMEFWDNLLNESKNSQEVNKISK